jgi:hypothetical protein
MLASRMNLLHFSPDEVVESVLKDSEDLATKVKSSMPVSASASSDVNDSSTASPALSPRVGSLPTPSSTSSTTPKGTLAYLPESLLSEIFAYRLKQPDCLHGVLMDGLTCTYCLTPEQTASALSQALIQINKKACLILLNTDVQTIRERKSAAFYSGLSINVYISYSLFRGK